MADHADANVPLAQHRQDAGHYYKSGKPKEAVEALKKAITLAKQEHRSPEFMSILYRMIAMQGQRRTVEVFLGPCALGRVAFYHAHNERKYFARSMILQSLG